MLVHQHDQSPGRKLVDAQMHLLIFGRRESPADALQVGAVDFLIGTVRRIIAPAVTTSPNPARDPTPWVPPHIVARRCRQGTQHLAIGLAGRNRDGARDAPAAAIRETSSAPAAVSAYPAAAPGLLCLGSPPPFWLNAMGA